MPSLQHDAAQLVATYEPPSTGRPMAWAQGDTLQELLTHLSHGQRREVACHLAGISPASFFSYLKQAKEDADSPHTALLELVKRAEAEAESKIVGNVLKASEKPQFWAAGMTYLERKDPEHWGKRESGESGPKVIVQIGNASGDVQVLVATQVSPGTFAPDSQE